MIYVKLLLSFMKIGLFSFGGAYGAIPLIRDAVLSNGWMEEAMFTNLIALSESTPGPIMVNMATYIGSRQAGLPGAFLATFGVVFPSFVIILAIAMLLHSLVSHKGVQAVLKGIKPCLMGVILTTGIYMAYKACFEKNGVFSFDFAALLILAILVLTGGIYKKNRGKELSPILLIVLAAVCGCVLY